MPLESATITGSAAEDTDGVEQDYLWTLNFGPQHPATHTTLRLVLKLDGERVVDAVPDIGYLHSGFEKIGEHLDYNQYVTRVGGVMHDMTPLVIQKIRDFLKTFPKTLDDMERLLNRNRIFIDRTKDVGVLRREEAINRSCSGPVARASGVTRDLRKDEPYLAYGDLDLTVAVPPSQHGSLDASQFTPPRLQALSCRNTLADCSDRVSRYWVSEQEAAEATELILLCFLQ